MDDLDQQVSRWLDKASRDLTTAQTVLSLEPPITDICCYHAQQCVEKCLKAFLCSQRMDIPRTHDLVRLLEWCLDLEPLLSKFVDTARELTDYVVETRYPDDWYEIPRDEAACSVEKAQEIMTFMRDELSK